VKIRIATRAVGKQGRVVETMDDVQAGVKIPWVELDGTKYSDLVNATIEVDRSSVLRTAITFEFIGPVELVYVDGDGAEIGSVVTDPGSLPRVLDRNTWIPVPDEIHPAALAASQEHDKHIRNGKGDIRPAWGDDGLPT